MRACPFVWHVSTRLSREPSHFTPTVTSATHLPLFSFRTAMMYNHLAFRVFGWYLHGLAQGCSPYVRGLSTNQEFGASPNLRDPSLSFRSSAFRRRSSFFVSSAGGRLSG